MKRPGSKSLPDFLGGFSTLFFMQMDEAVKRTSGYFDLWPKRWLLAARRGRIGYSFLPFGFWQTLLFFSHSSPYSLENFFDLGF